MPELAATLRGIITQHLTQAAEGNLILAVPDASDAGEVGRKVVQLCQRIDTEPALIGLLIEGIVLHRTCITIRLTGEVIAAAIGHPCDGLDPGLIHFEHTIILKRRGVETRICTGAFHRGPDPVLIRVLAEARACAKALRSGTSLTDLVTRSGRSEPYLRARLPLAFLSPRLQLAILEGRQSPDLSVAKLIATDIPLDWAEQERLFL